MYRSLKRKVQIEEKYNNYIGIFYKKYLNAPDNSMLKGSISLSTSQIKIYGDVSNFEISDASSMGIVGHEVHHAIQKHSYRSVYSLAEKFSEIDEIETKLFLINLYNGKKWSADNVSMISNSFDMLSNCDTDKQLIYAIDFMLDRLDAALDTIEKSILKVDGKLSLLDLIEGSAYVAEQIISDQFYEERPKNTIYTAAWDEYINAGGKSRELFVVIVCACLRFGDVDDGVSTFDDFYPHPVDIFSLLINFSASLENEFICANYFNLFDDLNLYQKYTENFVNKNIIHYLKLNDIKINDSKTELHSYVRKNISIQKSNIENYERVDRSKWYYLPCMLCNSDGKYLNIRENCGCCSGTGDDWDVGENGKSSLISKHGRTPYAGSPPEYNKFGKRVHASLNESEYYEKENERLLALKKTQSNLYSHINIQQALEFSKKISFNNGNLYLKTSHISNIVSLIL